MPIKKPKKTLSNTQKHELEKALNFLSCSSFVRSSILSSPDSVRIYDNLQKLQDCVYKYSGEYQTLKFSTCAEIVGSTLTAFLHRESASMLVNEPENKQTEEQAQIKQPESDSLVTLSLKAKPANEQLKTVKKGRGKAKKENPLRSPLTCLIDDIDIQTLNQLAVTKDLSVSYLVRAAIKDFLKKSL
jgi:hypothetical protein